MGGADLVDMLTKLYRIEVKTIRLCIKVFWHVIDIDKVNSWLSLQLITKKTKVSVSFSHEIAEGLMYAK